MKDLSTGELPKAKHWDKWAAQFSRHSSVTRELWTLADVFRKSAEAKECFIQVCNDGCDPEWLAIELMRLPRWSSGRAGTKPFVPSTRQITVLKRVLKDLGLILSWRPVPMLIEPGAEKTLFFQASDFEASLRSAMNLLPSNHMAQFTAANAQALAASSIIHHIRRQTKNPHFREAVILFDAVLKAEGRTDLFNNEEKLKKLVRRYPHKKSP